MNALSPSIHFLLIDAGNSCIKWALIDIHGKRVMLDTFAHQHSVQNAPLLASSLPSEPAWAALPKPQSVWISNVAGKGVEERLTTLINKYWPDIPQQLIKAQAQQCGITNLYHQPQQLGSDRWAGLIGARAIYPNEPLLIATLGTATTLEALDANGIFTGGLIAASAALMMQALGQSTAQLPTLTSKIAHTLLTESEATKTIFALDTKTAISEGCLLAQAGLIERAWHELHTRLKTPPRCVLSGGAAPDVARQLTIPYSYHEHLVLSGLALIALEANSLRLAQHL